MCSGRLDRPRLQELRLSVLITVTLVLMRTAIPEDPNDAGGWLSDGSRRDSVLLALGLVPFAGIAFLWFVGVVRDRVGDAEDRFFATVFLGSGLLFVGMLFVAAAVAAGLVTSVGQDGDAISPGAWSVGRRTAQELWTTRCGWPRYSRSQPPQFCYAHVSRLDGSLWLGTRSGFYSW